MLPTLTPKLHGRRLLLPESPFARQVSRRQPPNHCQLLLYYTDLNSKIPRHRDFYDVGDLRNHLDSPHLAPAPKDGVTTMSFADVLIFTMGNAPMELSLSFYPPGRPDIPRAEYSIHPSLQIPLSNGTLFIFCHLDDLFYCHEAAFTNEMLLDLQPCSRNRYRIALVYRWLRERKQARKFHAGRGSNVGRIKILKISRGAGS